MCRPKARMSIHSGKAQKSLSNSEIIELNFSIPSFKILEDWKIRVRELSSISGTSLNNFMRSRMKTSLSVAICMMETCKSIQYVKCNKYEKGKPQELPYNKIKVFIFLGGIFLSIFPEYSIQKHFSFILSCCVKAWTCLAKKINFK